jgi:hypothetical protein
MISLTNTGAKPDRASRRGRSSPLSVAFRQPVTESLLTTHEKFVPIVSVYRDDERKGAILTVLRSQQAECNLAEFSVRTDGYFDGYHFWKWPIRNNH